MSIFSPRPVISDSSMVPYRSCIFIRSARPTPVVPRLTTMAVSISACGSGLRYASGSVRPDIVMGRVPPTFCPKVRKNRMMDTCMTFMHMSFFM